VVSACGEAQPFAGLAHLDVALSIGGKYLQVEQGGRADRQQPLPGSIAMALQVELDSPGVATLANM
jgi:hypothetical protein